MPLDEGTKQRIAGDARLWQSGRPSAGPEYPPPVELATYLLVQVPVWFAQAPAGQGPPCREEIAAVACAAVYGPPAGVPPDAVIAEVVHQACFTEPVDRLSVERALVYGILLPDSTAI